jgi:tRNA dimethylallyltransferase
MADTPPQPFPHCAPIRNAERAPLHPPSSSLHPRFLAGPTAVGKSAVALALAEKIGGEIISVDSMQVYRGLDIGTAKPTAEERARVPHHLIDVCDLRESFDAAQFVRLAEKAVADILSRGRTPIFCGGTGLYFKAYREGLGEAPATDPQLREELKSLPFADLLRELRERDPEAYGKIDRQNPRRVIRAVEVIRLTGKKFSEQRAEWRSFAPKENGRLKMEDGKHGESPSSILHPPSAPIFCLTRPAPDLHARINARVDEMFARGLVAETRELLKQGLAENIFAMQAIGYRQVVEHLRGERGLTETIELVKSRTRNFAKRQMTWFRRHGNGVWLELGADTSLDCILSRLAS